MTTDCEFKLSLSFDLKLSCTLSRRLSCALIEFEPAQFFLESRRRRREFSLVWSTPGTKLSRLRRSSTFVNWVMKIYSQSVLDKTQIESLLGTLHFLSAPYLRMAGFTTRGFGFLFSKVSPKNQPFGFFFQRAPIKI